jgi:hypothetical protein
MKQIIYILSVLFFFSTAVEGQNDIEVCENKTSHIISSEKVTYLQVGDNSKIIAEIVPEHPNMVRVKAIEHFEDESSLTLVSENKVYSLFVKYTDTNKLSWQLKNFHSLKNGNGANGKVPEYLLRELSYQILSNNEKYIKKRKNKKDGIKFELTNIYLKNDILFFEMEITNQTNLGYNVEGFNWWIDDKKQYKATNVQEYQVDPEYQHYHIQYILRIEMLEKALGNTGRKLCLEVKNRDILNAKEINY